jgi:signal transduction histidine kinase
MSRNQYTFREVIQLSRKDFITVKNRKIIHYTLLAALMLIQFFLGLTIYNEWINQKKLNTIKEERVLADQVRLTSDKTRSDYLEAQWQLQTFFLKREASALEKYFDLMGGVVDRLDTLHGMTSGHTRWKQLMQEKQHKEKEFASLKTALDTLMTQYLSDSTFIASGVLEFKSFPEQEILQNVEVETRIKSDSTARKNLFSRLMAAFSGKVEIQKEIVENTVKMKYGKTTTSGTVQEQMKQLLKQAGEHYKNQFVQLRNSFYGLKKEDTALMALNETLVNESHELLDDYYRLSDKIYQENKEAEATQEATNHSIRIVSLLGLITGLVVLTLFLIAVTRLAFQKETQLTQANATIQSHLLFKTKIVGILSHEIRSPLSLISIFTKRLSHRFSDTDTKEVFQSLNYTTSSLLVLVNQVLDFSKSEQHQLRLKKTTFDLPTEMNLLLTSLQNLVAEKGNQLTYTMDLPHPTIQIHADLVKIQQLFYNLVGNANRFTQQGFIKVTIAIQTQGEKHFRMIVEIKDNGRGIPPKDLEVIMEAMVHQKETVKLDEVSTGLGLLLCREIITLYKGSFSIDSQIKQGTTVAFSLLIDKELQQHD